MLAQIQQEQPFRVADPHFNMSDGHRHELKISNALATVAVADNDIVAVTTKRCSAQLEVIVCTRDPEPLAAIPTRAPTLIDTAIPAGLEPDDDEGLKKYLEERWSNSTLATHLWILSKLLLMKDPSDKGINPTFSERILRYVIATCYPKMIRRLKHPTLSQPYIKSLELVADIPFDESQQEQASKEETENDRLFLTRYLLTAASEHWLRTPIPNILKQAELAQKSEPFQLYTKNTCIEFHALLLELLERFQTSLRDLSDARGTGSVPTKGSDAFKRHLVSVMLDGYALRRLARGAALRMHLTTIAPLLIDNIPTSMSMPKAEKREQKDEECRGEPGEDKECEDQDDRDEELEAVQPSTIRGEGVRMPLWKSYRDWLRLMVVHFDAVDILVRHVTGPRFPYKKISIRILVAPPVDKALLPWRELFTDSILFPDSLSTKTNDDILDLLNRATSSNSKESLKWANAVMKWWDKHHVKNITQNINNLKRSTMPGWNECAVKLLGLVQDWEKSQSSDALICDIINTIQSLQDNARFFARLDMQSFLGTLHCEACLGSLLNPSAKHIIIDNSTWYK